MILAQILENKRAEVSAAYSHQPLEELVSKAESSELAPRRSLKQAISSHPHHLGLIAEIKKSSPSKGVIRKDFDPVQIAEIYQKSGANGLSVLTDKKFFGGKLESISEIRKVTSLPILGKDFIIDQYQIYESKLAGADAILLIADILSEDELKNFVTLAKKLDLEVLLEVHNEADVTKAKDLDYDIIGINNRNLHDFKVDLEVTSRLVNHIPKGKIILSESGIKNYDDVMYLKSFGVNAVLIGETFMRARDIAAKVREVMGFEG